MTTTWQTDNPWQHRLIAKLQALTPPDGAEANPGLLARLQRSNSVAHHTDAKALRPLIELFPNQRDSDDIDLFAFRDGMLVSHLYAWHPKHDPLAGSLGQSLGRFRRDRDNNADNSSMDDWTNVLMAADRPALGHHLRQVVSLLATRAIPVNYVRLLRDVGNWSGHHLGRDGLTSGERIRLRWMTDYGRSSSSAAKSTTTS